jgi:lipopolysaccharide transport protein LptA
MLISILNSRRVRACGQALRTIAVLAAAATPLIADSAQLIPAEGTYTAAADTVTSDFRSNTVELSGNVRVSQGDAISIAAQEATSENFGSRNGRMTFRNSVQIKTAEAELRADRASAVITNGGLERARAEGSPAQFEQHGNRAERDVRGRATAIEYDFAGGIIKLNDQVWFSNGKDEFQGDVVIYNVRDERLQINPGGQSSGRVRGIIRPRSTGTAPPAQPPATPPDRSSSAERGE